MDKRVAKSLRPLAGPVGFRALQGPGQPGQQPAVGWVPPIGEWLNAMAVYDNDQGLWVGLPLQALTKALLVAEQMDVADVIDSRNQILLTLPKGTAKGVVLTEAYAIPAGEDWWINEIELVTDADVTGNFIISRFPPVGGAPKPFLATDLAGGKDQTYALASAGLLGAQLRMLGGEIITVTSTTTGVLAGDETVALNPFGHKANRLV